MRAVALVADSCRSLRSSYGDGERAGEMMGITVPFPGGQASRICEKGHTELRRGLVWMMKSNGTMAFGAAQQQ